MKTYLDYNATTPLRPAARKTVMDAHDQILNASAAHEYGQKGRKLIEEARLVIGKAVNCLAGGIIFNSGATEGNNTVLQHFKTAYPDEQILIGATEHSAIREVLPDAPTIPVDKDGVIDLNALEALLTQSPKTALVSVMFANNETGTIQPMKEISALAHKHGAFVHSDAIQALGKIPLDMQDLGIDFLTLSAHKNGGTQGSGALCISGCGISPVLLYGGGQEKNLRGGTENISGIAAFAASTAESMDMLESEYPRLLALREHLEKGLKSIAPDTHIFAENAPRLPNTTLFSAPGFKGETLVMNFDLEGIAVSNGSACSSGTVKQSRVLTAMQIPENLAQGALRITTGWASTKEDIDHALEVWQKIYSRKKGSP